MADAFFSIHLNPPKVAARFGKFANLFVLEAEEVHKVAVLSVLNKVVYWCRVDTGRARAGFFAYADARGYSMAASLVNYPTQKSNEEAKGRKEGQFQEQPLHTRIINGVNYAAIVDEKVGIFNNGTFDSKVAVFEKLYAKKFEEFFDAADEMNKTLKPPVIKPDPAGEN